MTQQNTTGTTVIRDNSPEGIAKMMADLQKYTDGSNQIQDADYEKVLNDHGWDWKSWYEHCYTEQFAKFNAELSHVHQQLEESRLKEAATKADMLMIYKAVAELQKSVDAMKEALLATQPKDPA